MKKTTRRFSICLVFAGLLFITSSTVAQNSQQTDTVPTKIVIGIKNTPPFIIKQENGSFSGLSIDLWEQIALRENILFEYKEYQTDQLNLLLNDLETGIIDLSINPLTVTSERIKRIDFTQAFYSSGIAIAVRNKQKNSMLAFVQNLFSEDFIKVVSLLAGVILFFGLLLWLLERKHNKNEFRPGILGVFDGFWWSAVTMTTVGYGDKSPKTFLGRLVAVVWMFTAVIIISSFTGSIAASLTSKGLQSDIQKLSDLNHHRVGTMSKTSSELFLIRNRVNVSKTDFQSIEQGLDALNNGHIDVFVYDEPILQYYLHFLQYEDNIHLLPNKFNMSYYSFGLPKKSQLIKQINPLLLEELESVNWLSTLNKYNLDKP